MSSTRPCRSCGAQVPEENQFCTACGTPASFRPPAQAEGLRAPQPVYAGASSASTAPNRQAFLGPASHSSTVRGIGVEPAAPNAGMDGIDLAHGEVVKRVYELGRVQRAWGAVQGTLVVTDTRILYHAEAKNILNASTLNREIHLNDVRGVGLRTRKGMSAAGLGAFLLGSFLSLVVFVLFLGGLLSPSSYYGYGYSSGTSWWRILFFFIWLAACITVFLLRRRASVVVLAVYSQDGDSSPINVSGVVGNSGGRGFLALFAGPLILLLERLGIIEAGAAAESADIDSVRAVYAELGAVILDLQSRGTLGAA